MVGSVGLWNKWPNRINYSSWWLPCWCHLLEDRFCQLFQRSSLQVVKIFLTTWHLRLSGPCQWKTWRGGFLCLLLLFDHFSGDIGFIAPTIDTHSGSTRAKLSLPESFFSPFLSFFNLYDGVASWAFSSVVKTLRMYTLASAYREQILVPYPDRVHNGSAGQGMP